MTRAGAKILRFDRMPVEDSLADRFGRIRDTTSALCSSLEIEDCVVQSLPEASPIKWHLAHTTWFFEQFVLRQSSPDYQPFDPRYEFLFNSYYQSVGPQFDRSSRGVLSRPTVSDVIRYRRYVDEAIQNLLADSTEDGRWRSLIELGLNHEQQHQELMLTDIKHAFFSNPSHPAYKPRSALSERARSERQDAHWVRFEGGIKTVGADASRFSFDNERPQHRVYIDPFELASRLVTNGEYLEFVRAGGYRDARLWLSDGWDVVNECEWTRPLYWHESLDNEFTLHGPALLDLDAPVSHLSYYEADAFARWAKKRLPSEIEWELASVDTPVSGNLLGTDALHPLPSTEDLNGFPDQLYGDVWEWTQSAYGPYPGFEPDPGALGEYNGKFMSGRMVLRGGSCVTPDDHVRASYRNFFEPRARWQFSGVRLAQ